MIEGHAMGSSMDVMFDELIGEGYMEGTGVTSMVGIIQVNGMIVDGWRWGAELVWRVGEESLTVDIGKIEGMTAKGGCLGICYWVFSSSKELNSAATTSE